MDDREKIEELISCSAVELGRPYYTKQEIAAACDRVFGVDTVLIKDASFFVAEAATRLIGCGGWSRRRTLFGGDQFADRDAALLDPGCDAARIRAFFVHPQWTRRGIARALLEECESCARAYGFRRCELMATLSGVPFYLACGYIPSAEVTHVSGGIPLRFVPMSKSLAGPL